MSTVDLSRFSFSGGENAAPIDDLTRLPAEDREYGFAVRSGE